jgi:ABC-type Na+ efflux pump permease subunit
MCNISIAFLSHAALGLLGIAIGSLFNSRVIKNRKNATLILMLLILVSIIQEPLAINFPSLEWIIYILPPASVVAKQVSNGNIPQTLLSFVFCIFYSCLLITGYIKLMKKKMF